MSFDFGIKLTAALSLIIVAIMLVGCQCDESCTKSCSGSDTVAAESCCGSCKVEKTTAVAVDFDKPGFQTSLDDDGRLWVLRPGEEKKEKHITLVGAGPDGKTIKALDRQTALKYLSCKPGFETLFDDDGRLWVFRKGEEQERPEKHVTRVGVGPLGTTVKAKDRETLDAYLAVKG